MLKRTFDFLTALAGLAVLAPLLAAVAVLIRFDSSGPVFYRGERVGRHGRAFRIFKFRTMIVDAEARGGSSTAGDDPRITRVGRWLRRAKLDELPQVFNVLLGQMSFVGPRPQVRWAVDLYSDEERRLLSVRPGITDYASLRFRNEAEILQGADDPDEAYLRLIAPEKIRLGLCYVDHHTLGTDLKIIAVTVLSVAFDINGLRWLNVPEPPRDRQTIRKAA
ncbi:MAG: sugar transferase [Planctomycetaceae bacterium]